LHPVRALAAAVAAIGLLGLFKRDRD